MDSVQTIFKHWYRTALGLPAAPIQNVWDGLRLALQTIWKSYFSGFDAAFFQYPQEGYGKWGVPGLVVGTAFGLGHWCWQMTGGVLMAVSHVGCGMLMSSNPSPYDQGLIWDAQEQKWRAYSLDDDKTTVQELLSSLQPSETDGHGSPKHRSHANLRKRKQKVKDLSYYHLLDVSMDASATEIKRAYRKQALQLHPDKNQNMDTTVKFQRLMTVYQTLSNDDARELYDSHGVCWKRRTDASSASSLDIDAFVFMAQLFSTSSTHVSVYTGTLAMASMLDRLLQKTNGLQAKTTTADDDKNTEMKDLQQRQRQIDIALYLRRRIQIFVVGRQGHEHYVRVCQQEALAVANHGGLPYIATIGAALQEIASQVLEHNPISDRWMESTSNQAKRRVLPKITTLLQRAIHQSERKSEPRPQQQQQQQNQRENSTSANHEKNEMPPEERSCDHDKENDSGVSLDIWMQRVSQPSLWKLLWEFHLDDVSNTVRLAARRVVWDDQESDTNHHGDDDDLRFCGQKQRAHALWILGNAFQSVATSAKYERQQNVTDYDATTILEMVQAAFMASIPIPQDD